MQNPDWLTIEQAAVRAPQSTEYPGASASADTASTADDRRQNHR